MRPLSAHIRTLAIIVVVIPLLAAFVYVAARSGPLAPVPVTVATVQNKSISPALFGIGTVEARYNYKIGATTAARLKALTADVGDSVHKGQLLGEMDSVDLETRVAAKDAASKRARAALATAEAQVSEAVARAEFAAAQARRYEQLRQTRAVSEEAVAAKQQESQVSAASLSAARANLNAARQELDILQAEREGLLMQLANLRLISPVDGLVVARLAEPGSTVVAGQAVLEIIDPGSLWVNVRFDQTRASGLRAELPASIVLRSQADKKFSGRVARIEPLADPVTEELLAKVIFEHPPQPLPPVGELAEITLALPELAPRPVVPNASIKRLDGETGVWLIDGDALRFVSVQIDATDLDGTVQIRQGLAPGDQVVLYSHQALTEHSRFSIVDHLVEPSP